MRIFLTLIALSLLSVGCGESGQEQHMVGNFRVPDEVTMHSYSTDEPNYQKGDFSVIVTALPESRMKVVTYLWIEDFQKGLKPTVENLETLPAVAFDDVSESDAERMVSNLKNLGCEAKYEPNEQE